MIVADKKVSLEEANRITNELIRVINKDMRDFECIDDPVEYIYLVLHILGSLLFNILIALEGYVELNAIDNLNFDELLKWVNLIVSEYEKINNNMNKEKIG